MKSYFEDYCDFMDDFASRLGSTREGKKTRPLILPKELPGLANLLNSFDSPTVNFDHIFIRRKVEWNPFNQRLMVYRPHSLFSKWEENFAMASNAIRHFLLTSHEALHVLLWEPFFTGKHKSLSGEEFEFQSLAFEGFCFWYTDIIQTPLLREKMPDGEFAHSRATIGFEFHPHRALKAEGVHKARHSLDLYINAFTGQRVSVLEKSDRLVARNLAFRIREFYLNSRKPLGALHDELRSCGLFTLFQKRFCNIEGLPTLLPNVGCVTTGKKALIDYCWKVFQQLRVIDKLTPLAVQQVRVRRKLQTRAYFIMAARRMIAENLWISPIDKSPRLKSELLTFVDCYLDKLEKLLRDLALGNRSLVAIEGELRKADKVYDVTVRRRMEDSQIWASERVMIMPDLPGIGISRLGATYDASAKRKKDKIVRIIAEWISRVPGSDDRRIELMHDVTSVLAGLKTAKSTKQRSSLDGKIRDLLCEKELLEIWSVPLHAIDPLRNSYREPCFRYI